MPGLPSGTVTVLFTDIEGSTALWERDRQAMAAALGHHLARFHAAIRAPDGVHVEIEGMRSRPPGRRPCAASL